MKLLNRIIHSNYILWVLFWVTITPLVIVMDIIMHIVSYTFITLYEMCIMLTYNYYKNSKVSNRKIEKEVEDGERTLQ